MTRAECIANLKARRLGLYALLECIGDHNTAVITQKLPVPKLDGADILKVIESINESIAALAEKAPRGTDARVAA